MVDIRRADEGHMIVIVMSLVCVCLAVHGYKDCQIDPVDARSTRQSWQKSVVSCNGDWVLRSNIASANLMKEPKVHLSGGQA